jgi:hypothetical protein
MVRAMKECINEKTQCPPSGSSITPRNPCFRNSDEAPKMVSDPNHKANRAKVFTIKGNFLPARIKS